MAPEPKPAAVNNVYKKRAVDSIVEGIKWGLYIGFYPIFSYNTNNRDDNHNPDVLFKVKGFKNFPSWKKVLITIGFALLIPVGIPLGLLVVMGTGLAAPFIYLVGSLRDSAAAKQAKKESNRPAMLEAAPAASAPIGVARTQEPTVRVSKLTRPYSGGPTGAGGDSRPYSAANRQAYFKPGRENPGQTTMLQPDSDETPTTDSGLHF